MFRACRDVLGSATINSVPQGRCIDSAIDHLARPPIRQPPTSRKYILKAVSALESVNSNIPNSQDDFSIQEPRDAVVADFEIVRL